MAKEILIRYTDIEKSLRNTAFEFFYWFTRFEFALKENLYLRNTKVGARAEPDWDQFINKWCREYSVSDEAKQLIDANPKRQVIADGGELGWELVKFEDCHNELFKVVLLLKTLRNNLFHGGKHLVDGWDDLERSETLLNLGISVLDQLATLGGIEADYTRFY